MSRKIFILILALLAAVNLYIGFHGQIDLFNLIVGGFVVGAISNELIRGGFDD